MKRVVLLTLLICLSTLFTSCKETEIIPPLPSTYEKIQTKLSELQTYRAEATVRYISNKGENEYTIIKYVRRTGEYRIEVIAPENVTGNITVFDGENIYQINKNLNLKISLGTNDTKERTQLLLTSFLANYSNDQETSLAVTSVIDETKFTVLEAKIPTNHPYMDRQALWIDNETMNPVRVVITNSNGEETIVVTYTTFEYNIELEDSLFILE